MTELRILVGLPGCGKSTYSNTLIEQGYVIHSSDAIRNELDLHGSEHNGKIFEILHKRVKEDLLLGKSVIYDATNLSRKNRKYTLEYFKNIPCKKICCLFIVPIDVCKERNALRTGYARVPDEIYDRMLGSFNVPMVEEGFDEIIPILYKEPFEYIIDWDDLNAFAQDNPHHKHTLGEHMTFVYNQVKTKTDNELVLEAAKYHDIGKLYTKRFTNFKGEPTNFAHFYGHENYGAYVYLLYWLANLQDKFTFEQALYISQLINWHMSPLNRWGRSEKTLINDKNMLSEEFYNQIKLINHADTTQH